MLLLLNLVINAFMAWYIYFEKSPLIPEYNDLASFFIEKKLVY